MRDGDRELQRRWRETTERMRKKADTDRRAEKEAGER